MKTDITELAQSLKAAAEKAQIEEGLTWFSEEQLSHEDGIALHKADAEFIAMANPANILALVEALEKAQQQNISDFEIKARLCKESNSLHDRLREAEKRIAELESRTVTVKLPDSLDFDCEMENGDYDIDEEPYLRGKIDGFNYALTKIRRLNDTAGIKWEAE